METINWRDECLRLQAELDIVRQEMEEWKEKFNRLAMWHKQPRLPIKSLTTMGHRTGDDYK